MQDVTGLEPVYGSSKIWPVDEQIIIEWPTDTRPYGPIQVKIIDHEGKALPGVMSMALRMDGTTPYPTASVVHLLDAQHNRTDHAFAGPGGRPRTGLFTYRVVGYRMAGEASTDG